MGCACKNINKAAELAPNANHYNKEKKGVKGYAIMTWDLLATLFSYIGMILLIISLVPIVICILIFNLLFRGKMFIEVPSFLLGRDKKDNVKVEEV